MKKRILFLTTLNLACNPRLVKEIRLALEADMQVSLICFRFNNWSHEINKNLLAEFNELDIHQIDAGRKSFLPWLLSSIAEKSGRYCSRFFNLPDSWLAATVSKRSVLLTKALKKIPSADWVVGHNPGAIYPAYKAAQQFNCKSGFDVEDYHPGEGSDSLLQEATLKLMRKHLPQFNYVSFASESILKETVAQIKNIDNNNCFVVNNSFPEKEFRAPSDVYDEKMRLVWFSQHIDKGRGLEQLIQIADKHADKIVVTLFGNLNDDFKNRYIAGKKGIIMGGVWPQVTLHQSLGNYDIGLAIEPGKDLNNELALSNKLLAYLQSGLYVLATDTREQLLFMENHTVSGVIVKKDFSDLEVTLLKLFSGLKELRNKRENRFMHAQQFTWEKSAGVLAKKWTL